SAAQIAEGHGQERDAEAFRLYQAIDAESDAILAEVAQLPPDRMSIHYNDLPMVRLSTLPGNLVMAQKKIGYFYELGLGGVPQDYATAARWYEKALKTSSLEEIRGYLRPTPYSERLGFLYANGLGVPQDRGRARDIFKSMGPPQGTELVKLLDH